jgi:hypothetical protein
MIRGVKALKYFIFMLYPIGGVGLLSPILSDIYTSAGVLQPYRA